MLTFIPLQSITFKGKLSILTKCVVVSLNLAGTALARLSPTEFLVQSGNKLIAIDKTFSKTEITHPEQYSLVGKSGGEMILTHSDGEFANLTGPLEKTYGLLTRNYFAENGTFIERAYP